MEKFWVEFGKHMQIAILGATSEIAKDFIYSHLKDINSSHLTLYARSTQKVTEWLTAMNLKNNNIQVKDIQQIFKESDYFDVVINFIGIGNPAIANSIGPSVYSTTMQFDGQVIEYLKRNPSCKYIYLSSGAAFGGDFQLPVDSRTVATFSVGNIRNEEWYGISKLMAEYSHRALPDLSITDLRIFNYFSHRQNINSSYLISEILRALKEGKTFITNNHNIKRDYIHPADLYQLIKKIITGNNCNQVFDCYSTSPVEKFDMLSMLKNKFQLKYVIDESVLMDGRKSNYYSVNKAAEKIGYFPVYSSMEAVEIEARKVMEG
jgi:nucleoside-diphosphate-sugar epimerase